MIVDISMVTMIAIAFIVILIFVVLRMFALPPSFFKHEAERKDIRKKQIEFEHEFRRVKKHFVNDEPEETKKDSPKKI